MAVSPAGGRLETERSARDLLKRIVLGRAISTSKHELQLLPKTLALPVFSSDPLSSNAYATEEMMLVLVLAGTGAFSLMLPLAVLIALVLAIVVTSYRQTVKAYPSGGGSYIVAHENLGKLPGVIAASALLSDYVLTVSVSIAAGTLALTSVLPALTDNKVALSLGFIAIVATANLRGVKEAGTLFAFPTFGFVITVYILLATGFLKCLDGCPQAATADLPIHPEHGLTFFLILRAFASGSTALTGVEAISNGVQAFRRPQSRNAATTLAMMAVMTIGMFLGITALARAVEVRVTEEIALSKSVLAQIGETVFGADAPLFYVLQAFTGLILILAANTAYQDFPRLSAILARDGFMPRQFVNRGDRLVFSNGIVVLSILAGVLIWVFDANLTRLIQLYLIGVFTAFTLSQAGMVRRWFRLKEPGWKRSAIINGIGTAATGIVLIIITVTKFRLGAWIVIAAMPVFILLMLSLERHYASVDRQLRRGAVRFGEVGSNRVVFVMTDVDAAAAEALGYIRSFRPESLMPLYVGDLPRGEASARWQEMAAGNPPLTFLDGGSRVDAIIEHVRAVPRGPDDFVTVVIPELFRTRSLLRALTKPVTFRLKMRLLSEPGVVITDVPVLSVGGRLVGVDGRPLIPHRVQALVFVAAPHDASVRAVNYAMSLKAHETRAVFLATEPEEAPEVLARWAELGIRVRLDVVEAPFRDLGPPILDEIRRVTAEPGAVAAVVIPEFMVTRWWHRLLHNNRALFIKRMLLFEPRVVLSSVPFQL
ncbi:MAG: APC family permease, partial [Actinomycetota bacterium]